MFWGLDPELLKELAILKRLAALQCLTPTKEWPLLVEHGTILVVREWPNGEVTACMHATP